MLWWTWVAAGLFSMIFEALTPASFFWVFFGVAACCVGAGVGLGWLPQFWQQCGAFVLVAGACVVLLRQRLLARFTRPPARDMDSLVGEMAIARQALPPGQRGPVELRGAAWMGRNVSQRIIAAGEVCRVERVEGIGVCVRGSAED